MAEEMFAAKLPFVAVDPVGSWYGLRAGRDGGQGLAIPIFGGRHGDVQLEKGAGQVLADLVVDERLSCVLDLSSFDSETSKKAFLLTFAQRLYQRNTEPLHLFLEEADDYIPQRPMRDEVYLLRAWENIVRRGRARGLGITLITQRSASINKSVLTQTGTLIAMRTTSPQDRGAVEDWLKYHAQSRAILESLPSLEAGEAWVWSPQFLKITQRIRFRMSHTLDSGATPRGGRDSKAPSTMADVDLGAIQKRMAATIERAKADDPRELRKRIAELQAELKRSSTNPAVTNEVTREVEVPVIQARDIKRLEGLAAKLTQAAEKLDSAANKIKESVRETNGAVEAALVAIARANPAAPMTRPTRAGGRPVATPPAPLPARRPPAAGPRPSTELPDGLLEGSQQNILDQVATLDLRGITVTRKTIARWLGIHPNGGRFLTNLGHLRREGYLEGFQLTAKGAAAARPFPTGTAGVTAALKEESQRTLFAKVLEAGELERREDLAALLGIHPNGGRFLTNLGFLRAMGVVTERTPIKITEGAFV
jgi:hypothetical protein